MALLGSVGWHFWWVGEDPASGVANTDTGLEIKWVVTDDYLISRQFDRMIANAFQDDIVAAIAVAASDAEHRPDRRVEFTYPLATEQLALLRQRLVELIGDIE